MEQRPLRLGDIVDDYCTRERRVTNHAIVAVVENVIRQTRCATCDTEHVYKGGREPRLRKKPGTSALYDEVLANVTGDRASADGADVVEISASAEVSVSGDDEQSGAGTANGDSPAADESEQGQEPAVEGGVWLAHRRLIRATLPRTENEQPPPRPIPEFTMHQRPPSPRGGRGFRFRGGGGAQGHGNGNGQSPNGFGGHGGNRPGGGNGSGRPGRHRGKKHR